MKRQERLAVEEGVHALWDEGVEGCGVTVGLLDTGVSGPARASVVLEEDVIGAGVVDNAGHGTEMAQFILGFAPRAQIANVRILDRDVSGGRSAFAAGCRFLARHPEVRLINASVEFPRKVFGFTACRDRRSCRACRSADELAADGRIFVVAAGNSGLRGDEKLPCPVRSPRVIGVGATVAGEQRGVIFHSGGEGETSSLRAAQSGTSVAAALVSGTFALLLSAFPDLTRAALLEAAKATWSPVEGTRVGALQAYRMWWYLKHARDGREYNPAAAHLLRERAMQELRSNRIRDAQRLFQDAVDLFPTDHELWYLLGKASWYAGETDRALEALRTSVKLEWFNQKAHWDLYVLLHELGRPHEAQLMETAAGLTGDWIGDNRS